MASFLGSLRTAFWARWRRHTPVIPALGRQRQADFWVQGQPGLQSEFQDSQGYTEKPCLEKNQIQKTNKQTNKKHQTPKPHPKQTNKQTNKQELERWLSGEEPWLLFQRTWVQFPATTWWLTTICNGVWCPFLVCLKTATVYSYIK